MVQNSQSQLDRLWPTLERLSFPHGLKGYLAEALQADAPFFHIRAGLSDSEGKKKCELGFYKLDGSPDYTFDHYIVSNRRDIPIASIVVDGIDIEALDKKMSKVDWHLVLPTADSASQFKDLDAFSLYLGNIFNTLYDLRQSQQGRDILLMIRAKHFSDTPLLVPSMQKMVDNVNAIYTSSLLIPIRDARAVNLPNAYRLLEINDTKAKLDALNHELIGLHSTGEKPVTDNEQNRQGRFEENCFFSSVEKAYSHMQNIDDRIFLPADLSDPAFSVLANHSIMYDALDKKAMAIKKALTITDPVIDEKVFVIGWELNQDKIKSSVFEARTGLRLTDMVTLEMDQKLVFYPAERANQSRWGIPNKRQGNKQKPRGGPGL